MLMQILSKGPVNWNQWMESVFEPSNENRLRIEVVSPTKKLHYGDAPKLLDFSKTLSEICYRITYSYTASVENC